MKNRKEISLKDPTMISISERTLKNSKPITME